MEYGMGRNPAGRLSCERVGFIQYSVYINTETERIIKMVLFGAGLCELANIIFGC